MNKDYIKYILKQMWQISIKCINFMHLFRCIFNIYNSEVNNFFLLKHVMVGGNTEFKNENATSDRLQDPPALTPLVFQVKYISNP